MLSIRMRLLGYFKRWFVVRREARGYVWSGKTPYVFLLMLVTFRPTAGEAAGIRDVVIPANANQPRIVAELWTPCSTPAPEMLIDRDGFPTTIRAVRNCVVTRKNLPLVLFHMECLKIGSAIMTLRKPWRMPVLPLLLSITRKTPTTILEVSQQLISRLFSFGPSI